MRYRVQLTRKALEDLKRLFSFLEIRDQKAAVRASAAIAHAMTSLEDFPWSCRAAGQDARLRELVISFGRQGYVCRFRILGELEIHVLGFRHQREEGYD